MKTLFTLMLVLLSFGSFAQSAPDSSTTVLNAAYAKAHSEHKNVILMFHASWCGWCKKMEASINDPDCQKLFNDNYIIVYLDILERPGKQNLENPGGTDVMKSFNGDPNGGIPFWVILTPSGKAYGNSYKPPLGATTGTAKDNVGCPAEADEVAYFMSLLKSSSKLSDQQLAVIKNRFLKNKPASTNAN
ncbi:thioredoxin family protein [Mucilaginibacter sp. L196]|uniref:thioredoxin family protein n=1 Tax=Mucilaginibacter sp. L196 TaxID=1641870 RepID=UPI00131E0D54|nr:thioredoxin family protein [Mucilaginibacter sp. L196]